MKHETKKISKIVDEILTYFLYHFKARAEISVVPESDRFLMRFRFAGFEITDEQFEALDKRLVVQRKPELEDYYWQLAGEIEDSNEMMLVGMMCDSIKLQRTRDAITLELERKL